MCSSNVQSMIDDVVDQFVQDGRMFTAFDVTQDVKDKLEKDGTFDHTQHRHRELKNDVHRSMDRHPGYSKELVDVGAPTKAFVYHAFGDDPTQYVGRNTTSSVSTNAVISSAPVSAVVPAITDGKDHGNPDARGTVCVPSFHLRNAGFNPGDKAYVSLASRLGVPCLAISKSPGPNGDLTTYTVDVYGNVRITSSTFVNAGINSQAYQFDGSSSQVYVYA